MQISGASERTGTRILKATGWKLDAACDSFFQANGNSSVQAKETESLTKLFESYRTFSDEVDTVGVDGTMKYFGDDLGINLEGVEFLIPCEIIQVPAIGEMTKSGFVEGWKKLGLDTLPKQKSYIEKALNSLSVDTELFKRVYKHTFICAREKGQKALFIRKCQCILGTAVQQARATMEDCLNELDSVMVGILNTELEQKCEQRFMEPNISIPCEDNGG
ncbi:hypothetical protein EYC84_008480 [Monilinia fructicola]|nr:hypothetical protein EYC84_008480 [Monilinia fructicola]